MERQAESCLVAHLLLSLRRGHLRRKQMCKETAAGLCLDSHQCHGVKGEAPSLMGLKMLPKPKTQVDEYIERSNDL